MHIVDVVVDVTTITNTVVEMTDTAAPKTPSPTLWEHDWVLVHTVVTHTARVRTVLVLVAKLTINTSVAATPTCIDVGEAPTQQEHRHSCRIADTAATSETTVPTASVATAPTPMKKAKATATTDIVQDAVTTAGTPKTQMEPGATQHVSTAVTHIATKHIANVAMAARTQVPKHVVDIAHTTAFTDVI